MDRVFLIGGERREVDRERDTATSGVASVVAAHSMDGTRQAHRWVARGEVDQYVNEVAGAKVAFTGDERPTGREVCKRVVPDDVPTLENERTPLEIHPVV